MRHIVFTLNPPASPRHHLVLQTGCQYISDKTSARYSELEVAQGDAAVAADVDPGAVANKVMKEGAREMERQEGKHHGRVFSGSDAALAQSVAHWKDDASAPEHKVAEKIRQRIAHTQDVYAHPIAQGPNPDAGRDRNDTRMRHFRGSPNWDHVTATTRHERNPDVIRE